LTKSNNPFIIKTLNKLGIEDFLHLIKGIYKKVKANIILSDAILNAFPLRLERRKGCLLSPYLFNIIGEVLDNEIRKKKKKEHMDWKVFGVTEMLICIFKNMQLVVCQLYLNKAVNKILPGNINLHKNKLMPMKHNNKLIKSLLD